MGNKFFAPGEKRASRVNDLFETVAPRYDLINDLQSFGLHRYWKRRLVQLAQPKPRERILDLCCGTGDIALAFARAGAIVLGLDFSSPMLAIAQRRLSAGMSLDLIRGDALSVPFPDESFEVVTIGYGLRNLANFEAGLREMFRVLKPGGRLLVLDFGKPENPIWRRIYFSYLRLGVPVFGRIFCRDSQTHAYILESLEAYPAQRGVEQFLSTLPCCVNRVIPFMGGAMTINYAEKNG